MTGRDEEEEWKVEVDSDACLMSGLCLSLAPDVFGTHEHRSVALTERIAPDDRVLEAQEFCPAEAIQLRRLPGGEQVVSNG